MEFLVVLDIVLVIIAVVSISKSNSLRSHLKSLEMRIDSIQRRISGSGPAASSEAAPAAPPPAREELAPAPISGNEKGEVAPEDFGSDVVDLPPLIVTEAEPE